MQIKGRTIVVRLDRRPSKKTEGEDGRNFAPSNDWRKTHISRGAVACERWRPERPPGSVVCAWGNDPDGGLCCIALEGRRFARSLNSGCRHLGAWVDLGRVAKGEQMFGGSTQRP